MRQKRQAGTSANAWLKGGGHHGQLETGVSSEQEASMLRTSLLSRRAQTSQLGDFSFGLDEMANRTTCLDVSFVK